MCTHSLKFRTEYNTEVCSECGLETRVALTILQSRPPIDMTPFPCGYSRSKRFAKLLDGVLFPTPSTADDGMFEFLSRQKKFGLIRDLLKAMRAAKLRDKRYISIHLFAKHFVESYQHPMGTDFKHVRFRILKAFEAIEFGHLRFSPKQPFFNYGWLLCELLRDFKLEYYVRYVKKLRCKHRKLFYKTLLEKIKNSCNDETSQVCLSSFHQLPLRLTGGHWMHPDQTDPE